MNLQPMKPGPLTGSGEVFTVLCCKCGKTVKSNDVYCDMDGKFGDFYCDFCALKAEVEELTS